MEDPSHHHLGPYQILEELGRGGMGVVYKAYHEALSRVCAIKVLHAGASANKRERFVLEGQAAAKFGRHRNIVDVFDAGVVGDEAYIAMEFAEGMPLDAVIEEHGRVPVDMTLGWGSALALALDHAHSMGVIHRDIKPHNIVIDDEDEPLVLDFGLAKYVGIDSQLSIEGAVIGTPNYMPPEQADARRGEVDQRSDVYSLGATLHHMLSGRLPFRAPRVVDTLVQVLSRDPPRFEAGLKIPRDVEAIVHKAMEKEPERRYQTAREMAEDLERALAGEPTRAAPVGFMGRLARRVRRHPGVSALIAFLVLFLAAGGAWVFWSLARADADWHRAYVQNGAAAAEAVRDLLEPALPLIDRVAEMGEEGMLPIGDEVKLAEHLAVQYKHQPGLDWLSFADELGLYSGARRDPKDGEIIVNHSRFVDGKNRLVETKIFEDGRREVVRTEDDWGFDARERDWYRLASGKEGSVWNPPYLWYDDEVGITLSRALRDGERLVGVYTADFRLSALSLFLGGLERTERGDIQLLTRDGKTLARANAIGKGLERDPIVDAALAEVPGGIDGLEAGRAVAGSFDWQDEAWAVAASAFTVDGGLDVVTILMDPLSETRGDALRMGRVLAWGGGALAALILGLVVFVTLRLRKRAAKRGRRMKAAGAV